METKIIRDETTREFEVLDLREFGTLTNYQAIEACDKELIANGVGGHWCLDSYERVSDDRVIVRYKAL